MEVRISREFTFREPGAIADGLNRCFHGIEMSRQDS
jgi:hypothetical protein